MKSRLCKSNRDAWNLMEYNIWVAIQRVDVSYCIYGPLEEIVMGPLPFDEKDIKMIAAIDNQYPNWIMLAPDYYKEVFSAIMRQYHDE